MLKTKQLRSLIIVLVLSIIGMYGFKLANRAYASRLLMSSAILKSTTKNINADELIYYTQTEQWRTNSILVEPSDPYHASLKTFLNNSQLTEVWLSLDSVHSITRLNDPQKITLSEYISRPDSIEIYDAIHGVAAKVTTDSAQHDVDAAQSAIDNVSWIQGVQQSDWGRLAWVVAFQPITRTQNLSSAATDILSNVPYVTDLQFEQTQWVFEIDQSSGLLVSRKLVALTQPEVTTLYIEKSSLPQTIKKSESPNQFGELTDSNAQEILSTVTQNGQLNNVELEKLMNGSTDSPSQIAASVSFSLFAPQQIFLQNFDPKFNSSRLYYAPDHQCHLYRPLAFDFDLCAGLGNSTRFDYDFSKSNSDQSIMSISLLQAAKSEVVPLLQQSPPRWSSSQALELQIGNQQVQSWLIPSLHGNESAKALMFELGETFVQISSVGISTEQVIAFAQSLEPIDVKANQLRVFIPVIQK